ncbi:bifunctional diaminohydroxyphosphoribosylaminopyrimidine deaminase/5-amino-6-(5-phosphoribosylamino)uracil reductase RibD [Aurantimonas sp. MSK8Z-1]|uniref:bifunctional diaminohydroxyphosphoribosylaminopyrimidine deaminase/5-amino-6-(5-phosphoribosylamino)uracil reductase RibD n=1 Tax=Mangrovibrevibacter kandeliae TaxID=2968473 RepID=UPI002119352A|nr:bifunctional diaminohydroxyphosphoribosylaminopyrimidine deaminase/5-amino-6-(5-phosphoribosylamino)uracil reductase RibD [Aurantimonas sp. MSK8Z-1]MCW4114206.1 bifunctional diaminohydroxyphosphoribosylaminopyrimidine deaminase/5-amino-6-(5-phosphoribosylamino)uracil reductase RibD [Aurantimonas sp. MSK8Z-1]
MPEGPSELDRRFMAAAIRLSERHVGLTGTNPSVATLVVRDDGDGPVIVGRGVTAEGGRPHAETQALAEAGARARGATAYVTLEPCAHHGRTPPCAEALVAAGIARVVSAAADPDPRVSGRGHAILTAAGLAVTPGVMAADAGRPMSGYLCRLTRKRAEVTLKLALSSDGCLGRIGAGPIAITGPVANAQTHLLRARHDAVLVGVGTVLEDDPQLTCRLPGLADRSPLRIVIDPGLRTPPTSLLAATARQVPTAFATLGAAPAAQRRALATAGCDFIACEADPATGLVALPELLEDLAARGISSVLVEGGRRTAAAFLDQGLVDRLVLLVGPHAIGPGGIAAPLDLTSARRDFRLEREACYGADRMYAFTRKDR